MTKFISLSLISFFKTFDLIIQILLIYYFLLLLYLTFNHLLLFYLFLQLICYFISLFLPFNNSLILGTMNIIYEIRIHIFYIFWWVQFLIIRIVVYYLFILRIHLFILFKSLFFVELLELSWSPLQLFISIRVHKLLFFDCLLFFFSLINLILQIIPLLSITYIYICFFYY